MEQLTLNGFLLWLSSAVGSSVVASFVLEQLSWYQNLIAKTKKWVFFGSCSFLSVGSYCVLTYVPQNTLVAIAPFFGLVASIFVSVFVGEQFHAITKDK